VYGDYPGQAGRHRTGAAGKETQAAIHVQGGAAEYFNKDRETATQVMLKVHREGRGVCGVYTRDIASTKVEQVVTHARQAGHPLQCVMEEA
jgi:ATP-dependent Clp protease adapter protein ClpS